MLRRLMTWLAVLVMALGVAQAEAPLLVDRINAPQEHADFAFCEDAPLLEIIFPQILNCDAALVRCGGQTMVIDCCSYKYAPRLIALLEQLGIDEVDCVVNTHPHFDHLEGLGRLTEAVRVKEVRICFPEDENNTMINAMRVCQREGIPVTHYADGTEWDLGGTTLTAWLKGDEVWGLNDRSAVIRVQFGERTALFTADIEKNGQTRMVQAIPPELLDVDVLKYPHHGKEELVREFREGVSPLFSVITNNSNDYPGKKSLTRLGMAYAITVPGFVRLRTDGVTWVVDRLTMDQPVVWATPSP